MSELSEPRGAPSRAARVPGRKRTSTPPGAAWVQVNCTLFPDFAGESPGARAYLPVVDLLDVVEGWRAEGRFRRWFFLRKPPGLRLRFYGADIHERLEPELVAWLEHAEARDLIRGFRFGHYEPERFRFGGEHGMAIAHDHFEADSRLALRYEALAPEIREQVPPDVVSVILMNDLFRRCLDDGAEVWDVWRRLERVVPQLPQRSRPGDEQLRRAAEIIEEGWHGTGSMPLEAAALLQDAVESNVRVAVRLHAAQVAGRLQRGVRSWLAAACVFHWNRLGFVATDLGALLDQMAHLWEPEPDPG